MIIIIKLLCTFNSTRPTHCHPSYHNDTSLLRVVVQSNAKVPPYFKGDI